MFDLPIEITNGGTVGNAAGLSGLGMDGFSLYAALRDASIRAGATGAKLVSWPFDPRIPAQAEVGNMVSGRLILIPQLVKGGLQIDGVTVLMSTAGNITPVNSNQIGAYTYDGANFTRVAQCASDPTIWTSGGVNSKNFNAPYTPPNDMILWAAGLANWSAAVTVPQTLEQGIVPGVHQLGLTSNAMFWALAAQVAGQPNLPTPIANAAVTAAGAGCFWLAFHHVY